MKRINIIILLFISFTISGCSTVKYFTPNNQEFNADNISTFNLSSVNLIINDLRGENKDQTKVVIERIIMSLNSMINNNLEGEKIIIIDIIEHKSFFTFMIWNAKTILKLSISDKNKIINEIIIKTNDKTFNLYGYKSAEKVAQRSFEKAMDELIDILKRS